MHRNSCLGQSEVCSNDLGSPNQKIVEVQGLAYPCTILDPNWIAHRWPLWPMALSCITRSLHLDLPLPQVSINKGFFRVHGLPWQLIHILHAQCECMPPVLWFFSQLNHMQPTILIICISLIAVIVGCILLVLLWLFCTGVSYMSCVCACFFYMWCVCLSMCTCMCLCTCVCLCPVEVCRRSELPW